MNGCDAGTSGQYSASASRHQLHSIGKITVDSNVVVVCYEYYVMAVHLGCVGSEVQHIDAGTTVYAYETAVGEEAGVTLRLTQYPLEVETATAASTVFRGAEAG